MLFAIDLDGTLLDDDEKISEINKKACIDAIKQNHHVLISTGRWEQNVLEIAKSIELTQFPIFLVCANGAIVYSTKQNKIINQEFLDNVVVKEIVDFARNHHGQIMMPWNNTNYLANTEWGEEYMQRFQTVFHWENKVIEDHDFHEIRISKIMLFFYGPNKIADTKKFIHHFHERVELAQTSEYGFEITKTGINKAYGIKIVQKHLNINEKVVCFGDSANDLAMFKYANISYAMLNASDHIKKEAQRVTEFDNNNSGVGKTINLFLENSLK